MSTLVIAEHDNHTLHPLTRNALTAALLLDAEVTLLVAGHQCEKVAAEASRLKGVSTVLHADAQGFADAITENIAALVLSRASDFNAIVAPGTSRGRDVLPRIAARLGCAQVSGVTRVVAPDVFEHPVYAGNAIETVRVCDAVKVLGIRTTAFEAAPFCETACPIICLDADFNTPAVTFVSREASVSTRPELSCASIVVSGGRGLQNAEKFKLVEELADALGAAVGASRAAVDAGFVPNDYQVGQTGKVVAPTLYIALGISGAIQHLAGMKDSKVIVAINKDEEAPIFQVADYGLVGDVFDIVPRWIEAIKQN